MLKHFSVLVALAGTALAQAHVVHGGGHGLPGSAHWHAGDAAFFIGLALVVGGAITWLGRRP